MMYLTVRRRLERVPGISPDASLNVCFCLAVSTFLVTSKRQGGVLDQSHVTHRRKTHLRSGSPGHENYDK